MNEIFPEYFSAFELPAGAKKEKIKVYRACKTSECDKESFTPTYEEYSEEQRNNLTEEEKKNPSTYSLSVYHKPRDIKRFAVMNVKFRPPYKIAVGMTEIEHGICQRTKEREPQNKSSHVDWWLYVDACPHTAFTIIEDFKEYYEKIKLNNMREDKAHV